jgi:hypothetical protein
LILLALLLTTALALLHCGNDSGKNGGASQPLPGPDSGNQNTSLSLDAQLSGRYAQNVRIAQGSFKANRPGEDIEITFIASGLSNVKQFEFRLRLDPNAAFDLKASSFAPKQPFIAPPISIELTEDGLWRTGGASVTQALEGEATLGTLKLKTATGFDANTQVRLQMDFFSIGPSFSDRDDYAANDLKIGIIINER